MSDSRKDLPSVNAPNWQQRVTESLRIYMGRAGSVLDRGVTMRDLVDAGIAELRSTAGGYLGLKPGTAIGRGGGGGSVDPVEPDLTPPPQPTGFSAAAAISNLLLEHDAPTYTVGHGHLRTIVYGAIYTTGDLPVFSDAVEIVQFSGTVFAYPTNPATTWHLWIKWQTVDGVVSISPAGGTNGLAVTTGQDVSSMVAAMTGDGNPFTVLDVPTVIGGVTFPAGTYSTKAFIQDLQVSNAKLANLAVDNAKIANMSAAKLTAGALAVGQYIQSTSFVSGSSGWRINGDGTAELANAVVRGTAYIGDGTVGGIIIDGLGIRSANYSSNGVGFRFRNDGTIDLPSGAINIGVGANLLENASFASGTDYWAGTDGINNGDGSVIFGRNQPDATWYPPNGNTLTILQNGATGSATAYALWYSYQVAVEAGKRFEFSCYMGAHRCTVYARIVFFDANGSALSFADSNVNASELGGGKLLSGYKRVFGFAVAPANTATARLELHKVRTTAGQTTSWLMATRPFLAQAGASQIDPSPWGPSGLGTKITAQGISTPSLAALSANLGSISAGAISINHDGSGGYGYARSGSKWWGDGQNGWVFGRDATGETFAEIKAGAGRIWMASWGDAGIQFPGITMTNGGLTISQINVIDSINIAGNAVSTIASASGSASLIATSVNVPAGETWKFVVTGTENTSLSYYGTTPPPLSSHSILLGLYSGGFYAYVSGDSYDASIVQGSSGSEGGGGEQFYRYSPSTTLSCVFWVSGPVNQVVAMQGAAGSTKTISVFAAKR